MARHPIASFLVLAGLLSAAATAQAEPKYRARGLLHTGYSERLVSPGVWAVKGSSHDDGGSTAVALYRAAELAAADGATEIRVVTQKIKGVTVTRHGFSIGYSEVANLMVRAVRTPADRTACDMPDPRKCLTLPVAGILARYGPAMGMPAARPGETAAAPVQLVSSRHLAGMPETFPASVRGYATPADRYPAWRRPDPVVPTSKVVTRPVAVAAPPAARREIASAPRIVAAPAAPYEARLAAAKPVTGRDPQQDWTISD